MKGNQVTKQMTQCGPEPTTMINIPHEHAEHDDNQLPNKASLLLLPNHRTAHNSGLLLLLLLYCLCILIPSTQSP